MRSFRGRQDAVLGPSGLHLGEQNEHFPWEGLHLFASQLLGLKIAQDRLRRLAMVQDGQKMASIWPPDGPETALRWPSDGFETASARLDDLTCPNFF